MSQMGAYDNGTALIDIETITGNIGGAVGATAGNVDFVGAGNIYITGVPGTSTLTATLIGTTDHTVQVGNASGSLTSLAVGGADTVLLGNAAADPFWGTVPNAALANSSVTLSDGANITVTGSPLSLGGTATIAVSGTTDHALQLGNASGSLTSLAVAANGEILIGSTGADPVISTLTEGSGIAITNAAGSVTISSSGGGLTWSVVSSAQAMLPDHGYIFSTGGASVTFTLPVTAPVGSVIKLVYHWGGKWKIAQNSGQEIRFNTGLTSSGIAGYLESTDIGGSVELVCAIADTNWTVASCMGNITIV